MYNYDTTNEVSHRGGPTGATYTIYTDQATLDALASGALDPRKAVTSKKVKLEGAVGSFFKLVRTELEG